MIEQIDIKNFKSIRSVSVKLTPVTVLIGRSGVGKSNFLRAIRFLRNYLLVGEGATAAEGGWHAIFPFGVKSDLSFRIQFRIPGYEKLFQYEVVWSLTRQGSTVPSTERLRLGSDVIFGRSADTWEAWPDARPKPAVERRLYLSSFPTVSEAVLTFSFLTNGIGWHDFPADVFRAPIQENQEFTAFKGLHDSAANYLDVLRDLTQNLQSQHARRQILARIRQINP